MSEDSSILSGKTAAFPDLSDFSDPGMFVRESSHAAQPLLSQEVGSYVGVGEPTGASNETIHVRTLQIAMLYQAS